MNERKSLKTAKSVKSLQITNQVFPRVIEYYKRGYMAKSSGSTQIVYHTGVDPIEVDYAMGLIPMFPENFSAACGAVQLAPPLIEVTESMGAPQDLCSYFKNHYGFMKGTFPDEVNQALSRIRLPEPDLVVSCKKLCRLHPLWMKLTADHYNVPYFSLDAPIMPPRYDENEPEFERLWGIHYMRRVGREALEYCVEQFYEYIAFLETHTGKKMDWDRLRETVALASELGSLFYRVLELRQNVPCPVGGEDVNSLVFFPACLSGTQEAVDVFGKVLEEVEERVASGKGVVPEERFRLLFEGIPPWFNMGLFNYFHKFGAVSVEEFYPRTWCARMDPDRPLESLAFKYMLATNATASYTATKETALQRVRLYKADGAILWNLPTCRVMASTMLPRLQTVMEQDAGIPTLMLDADQVDPRRYNEAHILGRIEAFMEMMEQKKYGSGTKTG
jgi:benzoyl-CoA reductase subunit B